jgi:hypothetical protein
MCVLECVPWLKSFAESLVIKGTKAHLPTPKALGKEEVVGPRPIVSRLRALGPCLADLENH